jgi:hypothetical protein
MRSDAPPTSPPKAAKPTPSAPTAPRREPPKRVAAKVPEPTAPGRSRAQKRPPQAQVRKALEFPIHDKDWEEPEPPDDEGSDEDLEQLARRIRPIVDRFGSMHGLKDWLFALKTIEEIRAKRLDNDETEGSLIRRDFVRTHVFGAIEAANIRLVNDAPQTIARRIYAAAKAEQAVEEAEIVVHEIISSHLKPVKATAARNLRGE